MTYFVLSLGYIGKVLSCYSLLNSRSWRFAFGPQSSFDLLMYLSIWSRPSINIGQNRTSDIDQYGMSNMSVKIYPKKYAHGFVVLCFVVVMQSFIMNSHEVFNHIHQGCFAGSGAIVRLPQCQWSKPDGYGKISQCITTTRHSKAKTVCIFRGIYCIFIYST